MMRALGYLLILGSVAGTAMASIIAPEISGSTAAAAVTLVTGAVLVLRGRRARK